MESSNNKLSNGFQFGLLAGLGALTAIALANAAATLAGIITYVALAIFIALGLEPIVSFIQTKLKLKRSLAILTVVGALIALLASVIWQLLPTVVAEFGNFVSIAPHALDSIKSLELVTALDKQFNGSVSNAIDGAANFLSNSENWPTMLGGVVQVSLNVFNGFFGALIVFTLSLYFMSAMDSFKGYIYNLVPASKRATFKDLAEQIADSIGRYVMGQVTIALINATAGFIMMSIMGVQFSLVLALITFGLALIPLVGSISGAAIVTIVALTTSPSTALIIGIYYLVYLQIEAYLISPRIMSKAVSVPSAVIVVAALAGGALLGVLGALVAIPVAASIILIIRQVWVPRQLKN
jgi:predicted PurR-regulated permease PerM